MLRHRRHLHVSPLSPRDTLRDPPPPPPQGNFVYSPPPPPQAAENTTTPPPPQATEDIAPPPPPPPPSPQGDISYTPPPPPPQDASLLPFEPCSSIMISGPTGSGKSRWTFQFLRQLDYVYGDRPPRKIMYCYGVYQSLFEDMERELPAVTFHQGLPTRADIEEFSGGEHDLIVLDDLMHEVLESKDTELLFTRGCHQSKLSVMCIVQFCNNNNNNNQQQQLQQQQQPANNSSNSSSNNNSSNSSSSSSSSNTGTRFPV